MGWTVCYNELTELYIFGIFIHAIPCEFFATDGLMSVNSAQLQQQQLKFLRLWFHRRVK